MQTQSQNPSTIKIKYSHKNFRCMELETSAQIPENAKETIKRMIDELNSLTDRACLDNPSIQYLIVIVMVVSFIVAVLVKNKYILLIPAASFLILVIISCWHSSVEIQFTEDVNKVVYKYKTEVAPFYQIVKNFKYYIPRSKYYDETVIILAPSRAYMPNYLIDTDEFGLQNTENGHVYLTDRGRYQSPDYVLNYIQNSIARNNSTIYEREGPQFLNIQDYNSTTELKEHNLKHSSLSNKHIKFYQFKPYSAQFDGYNNSQRFANVEAYKTLNSAYYYNGDTDIKEPIDNAYICQVAENKDLIIVDEEVAYNTKSIYPSNVSDKVNVTRNDFLTYNDKRLTDETFDDTENRKYNTQKR